LATPPFTDASPVPMEKATSWVEAAVAVRDMLKVLRPRIMPPKYRWTGMVSVTRAAFGAVAVAVKRLAAGWVGSGV